MAAADLVRHLKARTMAGLPHIGVLGPTSASLSAKEVDEPSNVEEDEYTEPTESEADPDFADWKFVPHKLAYHLTIASADAHPLKTRVSFFIRVKEGCDGDLAITESDRPNQYILSTDELMAAFRKYDLTITSHADFRNPIVELSVDGQDKPIGHENVSVEAKSIKQTISVHVEDLSDPFMAIDEGTPALRRQEYKITIRKTISRQAGNTQVYVEILNESPRTSRSVIPERRKDEQTGLVEREEDALTRYRNRVDKSNDSLWESFKPRLLKIEKQRNNPEGNRYGYLMELEAAEHLVSKEYPYREPDSSRTVNCVMDDSGLNKNGEIYTGFVTFRDYSVFQEEVPVMRPGLTPLELFEKLDLDRELAAVIAEDIKIGNFYLFQERSIERIIECMRSNEPRSTILISARTAGGKTEAFLVPIVQHCIENRQKGGVKALIFYPTKALANDQTNRYIEILYHLNKRLAGRKITLGLLHGDISKAAPDPGTEEDWDLPLACPRCKEGTLQASLEELVCDRCNEKIDFVRIRHRQLVYSDPPDILVTNPDTLIWDLMMRPQNHSILGRPTFVCQDCKTTYAPKARKRKCDNRDCNSSNISEIRPTVPRFIVFDEIHLFKGTFGINCSYFLSRLEGVLRSYQKEHHEGTPLPLVRIGSTATISNPLEFARDFFDTRDVTIVPTDDSERALFYLSEKKDETIRRIHVYVMPYAYNTDSTVGKAIQYIQKRSRLGSPPTELEKKAALGWGQFLQTLTFVNSIRSSNNLIALAKRAVAEDFKGDLKIDGHTTDFDRKQRGKIERMFNREELHCIFATQTLEVGVDFRRVDVVIINGFPYSFNDYLQRIGRGGRNRDSIVLTVCQSWKPIDHYYYSNGRRSLRDPIAHIEPVPITRDNIEAAKKHARGAFFDYIAMGRDATDYFEDFRKLKDIKRVAPDLHKYVNETLNVSKFFMIDVEKAATDFLDYLSNLAQNELTTVALFKKFRDTINERYQLTSLRSTDREVTVEVMWGK